MNSAADPQLIPRVRQVFTAKSNKLFILRLWNPFFFFQYLEENIHQSYVDVGVMAKSLQERYREYSRRKSVPFRMAVEQGKILKWNLSQTNGVSNGNSRLFLAYKTVLHSYGLDSNPGSEEEGSDLEVMDVSCIFSLLWINFLGFS